MAPGLLQAAINATSLALIAAGVSITDYVVAVSVASLSSPSCPLLDISNTEQSDLPHLTVATLPRSQKVTLVQLETRLNIETFEEILKIGVEACTVLRHEMDHEVRRWSMVLNSNMIGPRQESNTILGLIHKTDPHATNNEDVEMD